MHPAVFINLDITSVRLVLTDDEKILWRLGPISHDARWRATGCGPLI